MPQLAGRQHTGMLDARASEDAGTLHAHIIQGCPAVSETSRRQQQQRQAGRQGPLPKLDLQLGKVGICRYTPMGVTSHWSQGVTSSGGGVSAGRIVEALEVALRGAGCAAVRGAPPREAGRQVAQPRAARCLEALRQRPTPAQGVLRSGQHL